MFYSSVLFNDYADIQMSNATTIWADSEPSRGSTSHSPQDEVADWRNARNEMDEKDVSEGTYNEDTFWQKLRLAAERKVYEELSFDVAQRFMNAEGK
ncbi:uncharacterized protein [Elaeis guineensis]|uniref:uncharacterized protein isoform X6 n=1 Tax=Elaeis guineensis var. tenera TaxID=51953 RepID=UPI003C6D50D1